jgi:hypothetical protein
VDAEVSSTTESDTQRLIIWLEEQRRADHDRLVQLTRVVEQLRDELREHGAVVAQLVENESKREDAALADAINQLRDHLALVERSVDDHIDASHRSEQMQTAERERDLRQLSDLAQQVIALNRASEAMSGRMAAFAEEMKRSRDEHALLGQLVDELQRTQAALQNRVAVADEVARRFTMFQSVSEQTSERQQNDLARLDSQFKLLDLRFTRELTEIRHSTDELIARSEERLRPIADLTRQVSMLVEHGDAVDHRIDGLVRDVETMNVDLGRIDAQGKVDRGTLKRLSEAIEAQNQHVDGVSALAWQLVERVDSVTTGFEDLRIELDAIARRIEEFERRLVRLEEERLRLGSELAEVTRALRADHRDAGSEPLPLADRVSSDIASLRSQVQVIQGLAIQHLRRTVEELQQQLRELEAHQS